MKVIKKIAAFSLAGVMGISIPMTVLGASPEFARSDEEWARLQDNTLEYEEITDLIHEYNVTVQNNQYDYNKFLKDYGKTKEDVAQEYRKLASDLESDMSGDDSAMAKVSDLQLQLQADQLREQADNNVEDSYIYYLTYCQAEDNLALSAQSRFISYERNRLELESAKEQKKVLETAYDQTAVKQQAGTATQADVLSARESVLEQEKNIANLELKIENTRQNLIIMLGWRGNAQPEIKELPQVDLNEIAEIDYEADKQKALENNYTLKINKRKLENAIEKANKEDLEKTISANEKQIEVSLLSSWQGLMTAKLSYEQAAADEAAEERNTELANQKWNAGVITRYELEQQEYALAEKQRMIQTSSMDLLEALETYRWGVKGLASAQ